jgi:hypothetical protein
MLLSNGENEYDTTANLPTIEIGSTYSGWNRHSSSSSR